MSFAVVTDSLAGLPLEEVASRGLVVIPLSYYMNGEEHTCQAPEEYDSAAFFRAMKQRVEVKTSMIPPQRFAEYWEPLLQSDLDILFLSASSGISSSYQSASIAAQQRFKAFDRLPQRDVAALQTGEDFGHREGLGEILLHPAGTIYGLAVLSAELFHTKDGNNILQLTIALQQLLGSAGHGIVPLSDDVRLQDAGGGFQGIYCRINALLHDFTGEDGRGV